VDLDEFRPRDLTPESVTPALGWIGTPSTFPSLESIFPVLERLAKKHRFVLKVVGAGKSDIRIDGVTVENLEWELGRELSDFRSLDVGLYPIVTSRSADERWLQGKSGFKAIQYLAVGIPFAMSPVGVCAEIGEANVTHFNAERAEDWYNSLEELLSDGDLRSRMGAAGRKYALANYGLEKQADLLAEVLKDVVRRK
jgi:glycosyltransferase involved in cell wall biosynthesis